MDSGTLVRISPDVHTAAQDQAAVCRTVRTALERGLSWDTDAGGCVFEVMLSHLSHPAVVAAAHTVQRAARSGKTTPEQRHALLDQLRQAETCASDSAQRTSSGDGLWRSVDLAEPQPHLRNSVTRALAVIPARGGDDGELASSEVTSWRDSDQVVFCETVDLLHTAWPQMLAELQEMVHQVALLRGTAIDGFTDFAVHGAVMINQARLATGSTGLPGPVRLTEALVHEGTHTRCNAAQLVLPFLRPAGGDGELVMTPLRADPRPLAGLFQQLVVLVRSALLYRRLPAGDSTAAAAHRARQDKLIGQAHQGAATLARHREVLTDHGQEVLAEAMALLAGELGAEARQVVSR
jgi:HEXXH motif-containing protein